MADMKVLGRLRINGRVIFLEIYRPEHGSLIWWLVATALFGVVTSIW
jgi:hypothetical protein